MPRMPEGIASGDRAPREWFPALAIAVALVLSCPAGADVLVKQKTVSEGLGGFGNTSVEGTQIISGDMSRNEDVATYTGRMKTLVGKKPKESVEITRLDKEVVWHLDPAKKEYTELTFAEMREMMEKGSEEMQKTSQPPRDAGMKFSVDVKKPGEKQDVNGFPCEHVILTCVGTPTDPKQAAEMSEVRMTMDQWLTRKAAGSAEMSAYYRAFAEKFGRDLSASRLAGAAQSMYGNGLKELTSKLKDLEGFPIKSTLVIENAMSDENQAKLAEAQKAAADAQAESRKEMAKAKAERAENEKQEDTEDAKDAGRSVASGGGLGGALGGFLGKKLNKAASKKAEAAAEAKSQELTESGGSAAGGPLFKSVTEVMSISTAAAPPGSFDIPAGYTKKSK